MFPKPNQNYYTMPLTTTLYVLITRERQRRKESNAVITDAFNIEVEYKLVVTSVEAKL